VNARALGLAAQLRPAPKKQLHHRIDRATQVLYKIAKFDREAIIEGLLDLSRNEREVLCVLLMDSVEHMLRDMDAYVPGGAPAEDWVRPDLRAFAVLWAADDYAQISRFVRGAVGRGDESGLLTDLAQWFHDIGGPWLASPMAQALLAEE
jgi:hypothetical protein